MKKPRRHALALHLAHGAGVAVGQQGVGVALNDGLQARGNVAQGFLPADGLPGGTRPLGAHAPLGFEQALGMIDALGVARDFGAQHPIGKRMIGVTAHRCGNALLHRGEEGTGIGTIVRAGTKHSGSLTKTHLGE